MRQHFKPARFLGVLLGLALLNPLGPAHLAATPDALKKLDTALHGRTQHHAGYSRVIVRSVATNSNKNLGQLIREIGGVPGRKLPAIASQVAFVPNAALDALAASPLVERVSLDRDGRRHDGAHRRDGRRTAVRQDSRSRRAQASASP